MSDHLKTSPPPKWIWWEFHPAPGANSEVPVAPATTLGKFRVPDSLRVAVGDLGRASCGWSCRASLDVSPDTRERLARFRDSAAPGLTLGETLGLLTGLDRRKRHRIEACAESRRRPAHRRAQKRSAAGIPDEE